MLLKKTELNVGDLILMYLYRNKEKKTPPFNLSEHYLVRFNILTIVKENE